MLIDMNRFRIKSGMTYWEGLISDSGSVAGVTERLSSLVTIESSSAQTAIVNVILTCLRYGVILFFHTPACCRSCDCFLKRRDIVPPFCQPAEYPSSYTILHKVLHDLLLLQEQLIGHRT